MYSGEYDACDVSLSVYPHRASLKLCLTTVGIETTTFGILARSWAYGKETIRGSERNLPDLLGLCPTSPEKIVCGTN
jgi:hypothetical protein